MFLSHAETVPQAMRSLADLAEAQIANMQAKADEVFPKPQKLKELPKRSSFEVVKGVTIESSTNWWKYNTYYHGMKDISSLRELEERKDALLAKVNEWEAAVDAVVEGNKPLIEINLSIHNKVKQIMKQIGIPDTYSVRDTKSRAMYPKYVTMPAAYLGDLSRNIPTTQRSGHKSDAQQLRSRIEESYRTAYRTLNEAVVKATKEKAKVENETRWAFFKVKYGCDPLATPNDILDKVLRSCKYLYLAHYLELNRGDWSEGYDYAEIGLSRFTVETEEDAEIEKCISGIIADAADNGDIDGRMFRDCEYNYSVLFDKVDEGLLADYNQIKEMRENQQ